MHELQTSPPPSRGGTRDAGRAKSCVRPSTTAYMHLNAHINMKSNFAIYASILPLRSTGKRSPTDSRGCSQSEKRAAMPAPPVKGESASALRLNPKNKCAAQSRPARIYLLTVSGACVVDCSGRQRPR